MVLEVQNSQQFDNELKYTGLVVVDFFAHWCGPCRNIAPIIEQLSLKYPMVKFIKVDVDKCQDLQSMYGIRAMPTFLFFKNGSKIDEMKGADPIGLESKVNLHKVEIVQPFSNSKGHTLSTASAASMSSREARLAAFGHIDSKKSSMPTAVSSPPIVDLGVIDDEEEALENAIKLSMASLPSSTNEVQLNVDEKKNQLPEDYLEDDLVPVPVNVEILSQLLDMGFSDIHGRKAITHGQTLEGALAWLEEHQADPDIDNPYLVRREDAERRDINGNRQPLTEMEKEMKIKELHEKAKRIREQKAEQAKKDEILREKERRERSKKIDSISEEREKILRQHELNKIKKEKQDAVKERERLRAEIARDKEIRKLNQGVMPSVLSADGYNPSAVQYDQKIQTTPATTTTSVKEIAGKSESLPTPAPSVTKKSLQTTTSNSTKTPDELVDIAITLICKYRTGGDGGNALQLLITFVNNIVTNPDDPKYRSINMESNAFKTKLATLTGPLNLLVAIGFEICPDEGKLKYTKQEIEPIVKVTLNKLIEAKNLYQRLNV